MRKPKATPTTAGVQPLTCRACRRSDSIIVTPQQAKTLPWMIECRRILGGCGRWFDCTEATAKGGGQV